MKNKSDKNRRVVVTGLGVVSSIGIGWQEFWKNLIAGKSGISKRIAFDVVGLNKKCAGEVKNFRPEEFLSKREISQMGRTSQMAVIAAKFALEDSKLRAKDIRNSKTGVFVGTTGGEIRLLELFNEVRQKSGVGGHIPDFDHVRAYPSSILSSYISNKWQLLGVNRVFSTACAAGNYALGNAFDLIKSGKIDSAFAGGADGSSVVMYSGFERLFAIAPEKCQPFDKNRKGMIPGEGAGFLFLETLEDAQKRSANIYAEILGYGLSCDARHMTHPLPQGIVKAITKCLKNSKVTIKEIDYISAHGTGTPENDKAECTALEEVFGKNLKNVPVSSIKSMLGHTMGAAGAIEAIACCLAIKEGVIPPTINYETPDPQCDIDCVPNKAREQKVKVALNNSSAFGGNNACSIFRKVVTL